MSRSEKVSNIFDKSLFMNKSEILPRLQNQLNTLNQDLETLRACQRNLIFEKDLSENSKSKMNLLLDNMIKRIGDEVEEYNDTIAKVYNTKDLSEELMTTVDLMNIKYTKLVLQIEKIIVSTPSFIEIRHQSSANQPLTVNRGSFFSVKDKAGVSFSDLNRSHHEDVSATKMDYKPSRDNLFVNKSLSGIDDDRGYMKDTFTTKMNKNLSFRQMETAEKPQRNSAVATKKPSTATKRENSYSTKKKDFIEEINSEWIDGLIKQFGQDEDVYGSKKSPTLNSKRNRSSSISTKEKEKDSKIPLGPTGRNTHTETKKNSYYEFPSAAEVIKRELETMKNLYFELKNKLDTHTHPDFETEQEKLKFQWNKMISDNTVIQKDNSELMHMVHELRKEVKELKKDNHSLKKDMKKLKRGEQATSGRPSHSIQDQENVPQNYATKTSFQNSPRFSDRERGSVKDSKGRFLIGKEKNQANSEDELTASWVRKRLEKN
jgi:predicted nuclease with TOPRIM domain